MERCIRGSKVQIYNTTSSTRGGGWRGGGGSLHHRIGGVHSTVQVANEERRNLKRGQSWSRNHGTGGDWWRRAGTVLYSTV